MVSVYVLSTSFSIRTSFMGFVGTVFSAYNAHITKLDKNQYPFHTAEERLGGVLRASPS
jgi:hypothetical protein